jgi:hypothetical protein
MSVVPSLAAARRREWMPGALDDPVVVDADAASNSLFGTISDGR